MESQVSDIKKKLDIVEVIGKFLPLKKRGRHYLANCPFHGEKTPSFTISPELQIFKCFGCGKSGDVFTFVQEYEHVDFRDALEDLAKLAGVVLKKDPRLTQVEKQHRRLVDLNLELAKFYHFILTSHPVGKPALDYLLNRHITLDTIKQFRLGFAPSTPALTTNYLLKKGFTKSELISSGSFGTSRYGNSLYDRFLGRVIFPQSDFRDRILGFSGRILPSDRSQNQAKYINSPETDIYHKSQMLFGINLAREEVKKQKSIIIVEGEFDMISPYQAGFKNIVAIKGTAFTTEQLQLLHRYTDTLILGLDQDAAGTNASIKSIQTADTIGFDIRIIDLGDKFKDPDEAIQGDIEFFKGRLSNAIPIWDYYINSALKTYDVSSPHGKQQILGMVLPILVKISNSVTSSDYIVKLANYINSDPQAVLTESKKYLTTGKITTTISVPVAPSPTPTKIDILEEHLLSLIFSAKKPYLLSAKIKEHFTFSTLRFQKIFSYLLRPRKNFVPARFASRLPPELQSVFQDTYLHSTQFTFDSHGRLLEINKTINQIKTITLKDNLSLLSTKIAQAESLGDDASVEKLEQEYNHVLSELSSIQATKR
jgi:DNA primase